MLSPVFEALDMTQLTPENFDSMLENTSMLTGVFFWGHDCPNCEIAKKSLYQEKSRVAQLPMKWFHVNTYEHFELATRFGLYGIPTFLFFYKGQRLGKITPYPGIDPFMEALEKLVRTRTENSP